MKNCNILIIDEDIDDVDILSEALYKCGLSEIKSVPSTPAAFQYLQNCQNEELPKMIVTDVYLPVADNAAFLNELKKEKNLSSIPVIILTTHKFEYINKEYQNLPVSNFINKPDNFSEYLVIANYLRSKIAS